MNSKFLILLFVIGAYGQAVTAKGVFDGFTQLEVPLASTIAITANRLSVFDIATISDAEPDYYAHYNQLQENNRNLEQSQKASGQVIIILISFSVICCVLLVLLFRAYRKIRSDYKKKAALYESIETKNISLSKADAIKSNLVSILAHDFRSPLISTLYMMRLLERNTELLTQSERESFYLNISNDISVTLENFDATLQWIKRQLGEFKINLETVNIRSLLDEAISGYNTQLNEKGITVINNIPDGIVATSDREMLQFVNRNLLSNALKFSPKGKTIAIDAFKTGKEIIISVKDEGPGLSDNQIKKLFSISNKGGPTHQGAGIALSFSKDFIVQLGGRIWAENRNTGGTIFSYGVPSRSLSKIVA